MLYMIDTDICVYVAKQGYYPQVLARFNRLKFGDVGMSIVSYGELRFGAQKSQRPNEALRNLSKFLEAVPVLEMDSGAAEHYGRLRFDLQRQGRPIGSNDLWIASHCLQLGLTLVTNNEREFNRVPDLAIENWTL
jgi:tRNA(fMet)-specific endonuclease VapC